MTSFMPSLSSIESFSKRIMMVLLALYILDTTSRVSSGVGVNSRVPSAILWGIIHSKVGQKQRKRRLNEREKEGAREGGGKSKQAPL